MRKTIACIPLMLALGATPALARPTVIAELGTAPLLGTSASTAQMRAMVDRNAPMVSAAAAKIGLTPNEYLQFRHAIDTSQVAYVTLPRHLDAMSWASGRNVYALHDVIIPAGTHGWQVNLHEPGTELSLYMPAKCGNLSVVRRRVPLVAHHPIPTHVAALKVAPPPAAPAEAAPPAPPQAAVAPVPPATVPDDTPPPPPAQVAQAEFPPVVPAAHHALFLAPLLFGLAALAGGGGNSSSSSDTTPSAAPVPPPPPSGCSCGCP